MPGYKQDETTTDENGFFEMPPLYDRNIVGEFLPMEFVCSQTINVSYKAQAFDIWYGIKRDRAENSDSRGKPLIVACEILSEEKVTHIDGSSYSTTCIWDVESDPAWEIPPPEKDED